MQVPRTARRPRRSPGIAVSRSGAGPSVSPPIAALIRALLPGAGPAGCLDPDALLDVAPVLAAEADRRRPGRVADLLAVFDQAAFGPEQIQIEFRDRDVGDRFEAGPESLLDRVDVGGEVEVDLPVQRRHDVGELVV